MVDLVAEFYNRDLSLAEAAELDSLFENSAEEAARFAELALAEYKAMGLSQPSWKSRRGGSWKWPLLLLLTAAGAWAFLPSARHARPDLSLQGEAFGVEKARHRATTKQLESATEVEGPRMTMTRKVSEEVKRGSSLGVLVRQAVPGLARVTVKDSRGLEMLELFNGFLAVGERRFEWDGRLQGGAAAVPGTYSIEVKRGDSVQVKQLTLKSARP